MCYKLINSRTFLRRATIYSTSLLCRHSASCGLHTSAATAPSQTLSLPQDLCICCSFHLGCSFPQSFTWFISFLTLRSWLNRLLLKEALCVALSSNESSPTSPAPASPGSMHYTASNEQLSSLRYHICLLSVCFSVPLLTCQLCNIRDLIQLVCHTVTTT